MSTNTELLRTVYQHTHMAADAVTKLTTLVDEGMLLTAAELRPKVNQLRNDLRQAYCAAQELKTRCKQRDAAPKLKGTKS